MTETHKMTVNTVILAGSGELTFQPDGEAGEGKLMNEGATGESLSRRGSWFDDED